MTTLLQQRRVLWTLLIRGETKVLLHMPDGPDLDHKGGESLWKVVLTPFQMSSVESHLKSLQLTVERFRQSRQEVREKQDEEVHFTASLDEFDPAQIVYHTPECPLCFFFDPSSTHQCGKVDWPVESVRAAEKMTKVLEDLAKCPKREE